MKFAYRSHFMHDIERVVLASVRTMMSLLSLIPQRKNRQVLYVQHIHFHPFRIRFHPFRFATFTLRSCFVLCLHTGLAQAQSMSHSFTVTGSLNEPLQSNGLNVLTKGC